MKTITMFNAFAIAAQQLHETDARLAANVGWLPMSDAIALMRFRHRRNRQIATLKRVITARLMPPAPQRTSNGDYAGDLVNDCEAGRIDQDDIRSLASTGSLLPR